MIIKDLTGKDYNFLHVICLDHINEIKSGKRKIWKCQCKCGNIIYLPTYKLTSGETKSCGCIREDFSHKSERRKQKNATYKGVTFENDKYRVSFYRDRKNYNLGRFSSLEDAIIMRRIADTFTSLDNFLKWKPYRKECLECCKDLCNKYDVNINDLVDSIYDGCYEELYFDYVELKNFVKDFAIGCK